MRRTRLNVLVLLTLARAGESPTCILHEGTHPVTRRIEVLHAACKAKFWSKSILRQSHKLKYIFHFLYIPGTLLPDLFSFLFSFIVSTSIFSRYFPARYRFDSTIAWCAGYHRSSPAVWSSAHYMAQITFLCWNVCLCLVVCSHKVRLSRTGRHGHFLLNVD